MSFKKMDRDALYNMAVNGFGLDDIREDAPAPSIIAALVEMGVTWDMAVALDPIAAAIDEDAKKKAGTVVTTDTLTTVTEEVVEETEVKPVKTRTKTTTVKTVEPEAVLLKMNRENGTYEVRGYKFTKAHPFALVSSDDAAFITSHISGFSYATPAEAQEYYN